MTTTGAATFATVSYLNEQLADVPTIEEWGEQSGLLWQGDTASLTLTGSGHSFFFGAGATVPKKLVAVSLVHDSSGDIVGDASNHYNVSINRMRAKTGAAIVSRATTVGNTWPVRTDWNFSLGTFDPTNQLFSVGDILAVAVSITGTPAVSLAQLSITARFEPQ